MDAALVCGQLAVRMHRSANPSKRAMKLNISTICPLLAFVAGVNAFGTVLLDESFSYPDGLLTTVSSGTWTLFSGSGGPTVVSGQASIDDNSTGDVSRTFSAQTSGTIYSGFTVTISSDDGPSSTTTNGYFFALQPTGAESVFYDRILAYRPSGSTTGTFTFAIGSSTDTSFTDWGTAYSNGSTFNIVTSFDLATGDAKLWVNPVDETSTSVTITGTGSAIASLAGVALRVNGTADGDKLLDNLKIGTTFADVLPVPEPGTVALVGLGLGVVLFGARRRRA